MHKLSHSLAHFILCQGTSRAGKKGGMSDHRSCLLKVFFKLFDSSDQLIPVCKLRQSMVKMLNDHRLFYFSFSHEDVDVSGKRWKHPGDGWCDAVHDPGLLLKKNISKISAHLNLNLQNCKRRDLQLRWVTLTGHDCGAEVCFSIQQNTGWLRPTCCPEVWRQRCFFLICRKNFRFFEAQHLNKVQSSNSSRSTFRISQNMSNQRFNRFDFRQGMTLLDKKILKEWPQKEWHPESRPSMETWLSAEQGESDKQRLKAVGNIAMPAVTFLALQLLGHAERDG